MATVGGGVKGIQSNVGEERCSTMSSPPLSDRGLGDAGVLPPDASEPEDGDDDLIRFLRERVLFIGTQFSNLYTSVDTSVRGRVGVCVVFVCKYVPRHSRVSQPLNLRLCLLRHLDFLTLPYASPTCCRRRLNSYRLLRRSTPGPPPIPRAHLLHLPASPRPQLYTSTMTT